MPSETAAEAPVTSTTGTDQQLSPRPITPVNDMPVDGSAATFEWAPVPGARAYRLEVGADPDFRRVVCTIDAGQATRLTLYEMLPEDGSVFYWRVQAQTAQAWEPWSKAASFRADTDASVYAYRTQQQRAEADAARRAAVAQAERDAEAPDAPYRAERTSGTAISAFFAMMIVSFALLFYLDVYFVRQMHRADAQAVAPGTPAVTPPPSEAIDHAIEAMVEAAPSDAQAAPLRVPD